MRTKDDVILHMCHVFRSDFCITKSQYFPNIGITPDEKKIIYEQMKTIYEECIEPNMQMKKQEIFPVLPNGFSPNKGDLDIDIYLKP